MKDELYTLYKNAYTILHTLYKKWNIGNALNLQPGLFGEICKMYKNECVSLMAMCDLFVVVS